MGAPAVRDYPTSFGVLRVEAVGRISLVKADPQNPGSHGGIGFYNDQGHWEYGQRRIARILKVVDTRQYEEQGDRFVPIPGSGDRNQCARCGREHEVHAHVELANGSQAVVGTGCMGAQEMATATAGKNLAATATRLRKLEAELEHLREYQRKRTAAIEEIDKRPLPPIVPTPNHPHGEYRMGSAIVWTHLDGGFQPKHQRILAEHYRQDELARRGLGTSKAARIDDIERRVDKARKALKAATEQSLAKARRPVQRPGSRGGRRTGIAKARLLVGPTGRISLVPAASARLTYLLQARERINRELLYLDSTDPTDPLIAARRADLQRQLTDLDLRIDELRTTD